MNPLVSVITPCYNHEDFIGECIKSVLAQTYENWEMIIVDDGSTDRTWEIVQSHAAGDPRIRAVWQENKGIWRLAETYNTALEQSRGELVAVLEGDDVWYASKLATQVPAHLQGGYAMSFGQVRFIDSRGHTFGGIFPNTSQFPFLRHAGPDALFRHLLRGDYPLPALTVVINRKNLIELGGFQQPAYLPLVDYPTWVSLGVGSGGIGFIPAVLGSWRQHSTQTTWVLARDIARGLYRFAREFAERNQLDWAVSTNRRDETLLSRNRKSYLADASYRAAAAAFERRDGKQAWSYCAEIAQLGDYRLLIRCLLMFSWKSARRAAGALKFDRGGTWPRRLL